MEVGLYNYPESAVVVRHERSVLHYLLAFEEEPHFPRVMQPTHYNYNVSGDMFVLGLSYL